MPSGRNRQPRRRWYHRFCSASSADSSYSSESETQDSPPSAEIGVDHPSPLSETPTTAIEGTTPYASHSTTEGDWQLRLPPPPPFPILQQLPLRHMRNDDWVPPARESVIEILGLEDDDCEAKMDVVRNMKITEAITREKTICPICKEEFKLGEDASKLPCDHFFCFQCIHGWLNKSNTCPVCRRHLHSGDSQLPQIPPPLLDNAPRHLHSGDFQSPQIPPPLPDNTWAYFFPSAPILTESQSPPMPPPPPDNIWPYFFPSAPILTESQLVADELESSLSPSLNNSEADYDTARDEFDDSPADPQDVLASRAITIFPHSGSESTSLHQSHLTTLGSNESRWITG